jgi:hypothetical protein
MIMPDITIHQNGESIWASPPARPQIDGLRAIEDPERPGRPRYSSVITVATSNVREAWSDQVITAVRAQHPEVLEG